MIKINSFNDPLLGQMNFNKETNSWETVIKDIKFEITGDATQPYPKLVSHAHDIVSSLPNFLELISNFLKIEADNKKGAAGEIVQLNIESIILCWPAKPDDGMIYFKGPDEHRLWRCDYVNRKPKNLTFDN